MKKVIYTACGKGVFSNERGYQIYTCSEGLTDLEKEAILPYIQTYQFQGGKGDDSPCRFIYGYDPDLQFFYGQSHPSGLDYSSGRPGNYLSQALIDGGNAWHRPIYIVDDPRYFNQSLSKEEQTPASRPAFLPNYGDLYEAKGDLEEARRVLNSDQRDDVLALLGAAIEALDTGKQLVICDNAEDIVRLIEWLTLCVPVSVARRLTFDTYVYNPATAPTTFKILGVQAEGTAYAPEGTADCRIDFTNSQAHILFDFANGIFTRGTEYGFYEKYLLDLARLGANELDRFFDFCEREWAAIGGNVNHRHFLDSMAQLYYFMHAPVNPNTFRDASPETVKKVKELAAYGAPVQYYHSAELVTYMIQSAARIIAFTGSVEAISILTEDMLGAELAKANEAALNKIIFALPGKVLEAKGFDAFVSFTADLSAIYKKRGEAEETAFFTAAVSGLTPVSFGFLEANVTVIKTYLGWMTRAGAFTKCAPWLVEYFKAHTTKENFLWLTELFLSAKKAFSSDTLKAVYLNLMASVLSSDALRLPMLPELQKSNAAFGEALATDFTRTLLDYLLKILAAAPEATQQKELPVIFDAFPAESAYLFEKVAAGSFADSAKKKLVVPYLKSIYKKSKTLVEGFEKVKQYGSPMVLYFLNLALEAGDGVEACVALLESRVLRVEGDDARYYPTLVETFAKVLFGGDAALVDSKKALKKQLKENISLLLKLLKRADERVADLAVLLFGEGLMRALCEDPNRIDEWPMVADFFTKLVSPKPAFGGTAVLKQGMLSLLLDNADADAVEEFAQRLGWKFEKPAPEPEPEKPKKEKKEKKEKPEKPKKEKKGKKDEGEDAPADGTPVDGTVVDGTVVDGTVVDGTVVDGTVVDAEPLPAPEPEPIPEPEPEPNEINSDKGYTNLLSFVAKTTKKLNPDTVKAYRYVLGVVLIGEEKDKKKKK